MTGWQRLGGHPAYENPWIQVDEDRVVRPDGTEGIYGVVTVRHPAVFVVAVNDDGEVLMVCVDRYTTGASWEVPAGGSDGQNPLEAAQRELLEETGFVAAQWDWVGRMNALNGICRAQEEVFVATGLRSTTRDGMSADQHAEGIGEVRFVAWEDVLAWVRDGTITDGETVAALMYAALHLGRVV
ncbi:NUDIX hydrolase [Calidifontibacter sp. DB0510]|uniref:NUDIX hydrolase n=1 Tax=Metallococcus carri TaxID=1656884 RepID=A0A967EAV3_9MICO|nr:NUDIX hydrolase [Metallococcus carri]NHN56299.1 NUDIX hydrolase [Metallococcus carri]NOP38649.1 NUDIX hydrolase [Calidifontibacter sp. DB2511S]